MSSFNKVILMGNLTRDVEVRNIGGGKSVANIGLAVNRTYTTKEGEKKDETAFVDCTAWGRTGEVMAQYLAKGRSVLIEGRLKLDQWVDEDGNRRSKLGVVVESFQFVGGKVEGEGGGDRQSAPRTEYSPSGSAAGGFDDSIPF
jgi:single-strand DNA-binding protein